MTDKFQSAAFEKALNELNNAQREAVDQIDGPVLVVAGPGTGKTQIIAARIGNILTQTDTAPQNILCLTYTDAGTIAMRQRLMKFIGPTAYRVNIYTFHAFCNEVIQSNLDFFGKRVLEPISELENISLLQSIIDELPPTNMIRRLKGDIYFEVKRMNSLFRMMKEEDWSTEKILKSIDDYINDLSNRDEFIYKRDNGPRGIKKGDVKKDAIEEAKKKMETLRAAAELFPVYQKKMLALNRYDYSDMILWVVKAFAENENMLRNYQERYLYFLVDEFQDTNGSQNEILKHLTNYWDKPNCFTVGDDDQSIYEFQGARVKNIMDFYEANRSDIKSIVLTENYRSNQKILDASKVLIDNNHERLIHKIPDLDKTLSASHPVMTESKVAPRFIQYPNLAQEEAGIIKQIETLLEQGFPMNEVAIIYHRHAQAENLIQLFEKKNIPYQVRKKINILDLPLIQNILTTLKYLDEETRRPHNGEYLLFQIMHFHFFHIHPHDISALAAFAGGKRINNKWREILADKKSLDQIKLKDPEALIKFEKNITNWLKNAGNITLQMLFEEILNESGLLQYILKSDEKIWLMQVLTTFFDFLKTESAKYPRIKITQFLEMIEQMENNDLGLPVNKTVFREDGVNFITAHSAKGLEFQYVFLIGCTADKWESAGGGGNNYSLPDTLTFTKDENKIESLRRLFYVAMTRAKEHLTISFAESNNEGKKLAASQFVAEVTSGTGLEVSTSKVEAEELFDMGMALLLKSEKPHIELFDRDFIQSKVENFSMSVSALNKYLECPISYYFERILNVPFAKNDSMAFGNAVHWALNRLFVKMRDSAEKKFPSIDDVLNDFSFEMSRQKDSFTEKQYTNRMLHGKQILPEYYNQYINSWNKVVVTEYAIRNIEVDGVPVNGKLDKLEFTGADVNVVDYKTGSVQYGKEKFLAPDEKNPFGGDYWRQIVFYKILLDNFKIEKWNMLSGELDFVEKDEKKNVFVKEKIVVTKDAIEFVKNQVKETYARIKNLEFTEGCGKKDCHWCNFVKENKIALPQVVAL